MIARVTARVARTIPVDMEHRQFGIIRATVALEVKLVVIATTLCYTPIMDTELEQSRLQAWRSFLTAHAALINRIEHEVEEAEVVPLALYGVLLALYEALNQRLRMNELAYDVVLS